LPEMMAEKRHNQWILGSDHWWRATNPKRWEGGCLKRTGMRRRRRWGRATHLRLEVRVRHKHVEEEGKKIR